MDEKTQFYNIIEWDRVPLLFAFINLKTNYRREGGGKFELQWNGPGESQWTFFALKTQISQQKVGFPFLLGFGWGIFVGAVQYRPEL